jgi:UDP-2,3-diacylglucosamine pyrophosphatase LpxH
MKCKKCGSTNVNRYVRAGGREVYRCPDCKSQAKPDLCRDDYSSDHKIRGLNNPSLVGGEIHQGKTVYEPIPSGSKLIIGDVHAPYTLDGYLGFCKRIQEKYDISDDDVYCAGDIVDNHAISMHDHDPSLSSPSHELNQTIEFLQEWYKTFPKMKIATGNHDALPVRRAVKYGLPEEYLKDYLQVLKAPVGWEMKRDWWLDKDTVLVHGTGFAGKYPHANMAMKKMCNTIMGHIHTVAGVHHIVNERTKIWGMCVGCGIDRNFPAFDYARNFANKPVIACGVLLNGNTPIIELMDL